MEIFGSRDEYIDLVMKAMDRIDEVESSMAVGTPINTPDWLDGEEEVDKAEKDKTTINNDMDVDRIVTDSLNCIKDHKSIEKTKFIKTFGKEAEKTVKTNIAIHHTRVKNRAKECGFQVPNFQTQK